MSDLWIFGYGSLIWRPEFPYLEQRKARLHGWQRRFWQGSHDHRGVPERPGRVVTLVETGQGHCDGVAYRVEPETVERTFEALDHREKNGYARVEVMLEFPPPAAGEQRVEHAQKAVVYIAATDNHAFLGPAPLPEMVHQIVTSSGPSGHNLDYLLELAEALRRLEAEDAHVFALEAAARVYGP